MGYIYGCITNVMFVEISWRKQRFCNDKGCSIIDGYVYKFFLCGFYFKPAMLVVRV
jgi:hypothetical protein